MDIRARERWVRGEDSTRWDGYVSRAGDVVVSTHAKCGTTWMEHIILNLRHHGDVPRLYDVAPWIEMRWHRGDMGTPFPRHELHAWMAASAPTCTPTGPPGSSTAP